MFGQKILERAIASASSSNKSFFENTENPSQIAAGEYEKVADQATPGNGWSKVSKVRISPRRSPIDNLPMELLDGLIGPPVKNFLPPKVASKVM